MTDSQEQERVEDANQRLVWRDPYWIRDIPTSGVAGDIVEGARCLQTRIEDLEREVERLRARQREGGGGPITDQEAARFRQVKRARDNADDPYATHKALEDFLRHRYASLEQEREVRQAVEGAVKGSVQVPDATPQREGEREPDWPTVMDYITDLQAAVVQLQREVGMLADEPPADTEQGEG